MDTNTNNNQPNNDKNKFLEEAKAKIAEMKGKWEAAKAKGQMDAKQTELQNSIQKLEHQTEALKNAADDKWNELKNDFDKSIADLQSKMV